MGLGLFGNQAVVGVKFCVFNRLKASKAWFLEKILLVNGVAMLERAGEVRGGGGTFAQLVRGFINMAGLDTEISIIPEDLQVVRGL